MQIKYYLTLAFLLLSSYFFGQNQVQVVVNVLPPYNQNIADYQLHPERIALKLINTQTFDVNVQIAASLSGNNGVTIRTKPGFRSNQPIRISPAGFVDVNALQIIELFDLSNLEVIGTDKAAFERTGILPEGDYKLCVRAYNFRTLDPYSQDEPIGCSNIISLNNIEPPIILSPMSETTLQPLPVQNIIFNWTTPAGAPPTLQYILRIVEVPENRNPLDAMVSNAVMPTFEQTITSNTFLYGPGQPVLVKGRRYAVMVTAKDPFNKMIFRNAGRSEIGWFIIGNEAVNPPPPPAGGGIVNNPPPPPPALYQPNVSADGNCGNACTEIVPDGPIVNKNLVVGDEIKINKFRVKITKIDADVNGKVSGEGTMPVPFLNSQLLKLRVNFKDVEVNTNLQALKGKITAKVKAGSPNLEPVGQDQTSAMLNHATKSIENIVKFVSNDPDQQIGNSLNQIGFEMPLGINSDPFMLAITEVVVTPNQAYFSVVTAVNIPENNDNLGLTARNICMNGSTGICGQMELYLSNDFNIDALGLKLKAPKPDNAGKIGNGTFMKLEKNSEGKIFVKDFNVLAEYTFPNKSLVNAQTKQPLMATFEFNANKGWANWKAELTIPKFYVDGAEDIKFDLASKKATYDHSDIENPVGLPSPYVSTDTSEANIATNLKTWHGLYFPEVEVTLPDIVKNPTSPNQGIIVTGKHLIFDKSGFTGNILATNIINLGDGSLAGWFASVDSIKLNFWKSTFKNSSLVGRLVLPPSGSEIGNKINQLDYKCLLTNPKDKPLMFQFTVKPKNDMQFKAFYAKLQIDATSQILVDNRPKLNDPNKMELFAQAKLDGSLSVDDKLQKIPGIVGVEIPTLEFNKIIVQTREPYWNDSAVFKFNSPQKKIGGFDVSLTEVKPTFKPGIGASEAGIEFKGNLNLIGKDKSKFSLAASAKFGISTKVEYNIVTGRFKWEGVDIKVGDIDCGVGADLGALKLTGALKFYNKENPSECGFVGALAIKLPTVGVGVFMKAQFGSSGSGANEFKYFNFDAMAEFGEKGIPMFAGVNLYGLGGGIVYNMKPDKPLPQMTAVQSAGGNKMEAATNKSAVELLNYSPSGVSYIPFKGPFAVSATALFGAVNRNTIDANATLSINFNEDGGLSLIAFKGECRVLTDVKKAMPDRNNQSLVYGVVNVNYDFERSIFDLGIDATLMYPKGTGSMIKATGWLNFNTSPQGWYLHVGRPQNPAEINVMNVFTGKAYFEMGDYNIDPMPDIPQKIKDLAGPMASKIPATQTVPRGTASSAGFIHGANTYFEAGGKFLFLYGFLKAGIGYDIAYKKYEGFQCDGYPNPGTNGWYATGQAYLGCEAQIGIDFGSLFGKAEVFRGGAVALIQAGLPNPSWAVGSVTGYYNVFGGVFSGTFNYKFQIGNKCTPTSTSALDFPIISDIKPADKDKDVDITATPQIAFNLRVNNGEFEYKQVLDDGKTKVKYYKFNRDNIIVSMVSANGKIYNDSYFRTVLGNSNALAFKSIDLLDAETNYTITVKVKLLEGPNFGGPFVTAKVNGKDFEETKTITFTTGKGLKTIPANMYVNAYPLHSHKQFIELPGINKFSVDFAKNIRADQIDVPNNSTAKIYAVLYNNANNQAIDNKLVTVDLASKAWTFDKFSLDPSTSYRIEFIVKSKEVAATGNSTVTNTTNYGDSGIFKMAQGLISNASREVKGLSVGYISFYTSAYKTYQEKLDALSIYEISFVENNVNYTYSRAKSQAENAALFKSKALLENNVYILNNTANTFNYTGEYFVQADVDEYTTNQIFKVQPLENKTFPALYKNFDDIRIRNADAFLSEVTGIPQSQIKSSFLGSVICSDNGRNKPNYVSWPSTNKIGSAIVVPYVPEIPKFLPVGYNIGGGLGNTPGAFFTVAKPPIVLANFNFINKVCNIQVGSALNIGINGIMNPVINPATFNGANSPGNWSNFNAGVNAIGASGAGFNATNIGNIGTKSFR